MCNRFSKNLGLGDLATAGTASGVLSSNGYVTIPLMISGVKKVLIIQWGQGSISGPATPVTINYPIPFPNACFQVSGGNAGTPLTSAAVAGPIIVDSTGLGRTSFQALFASTANYSMLFRYIAIGY